MAVGKDTHVPQNDPESAEIAAARRLTDAFAPSAIDALLADAKAAGIPIDGVDGLLNQMIKAVLERALQTEMTHHLGYHRDDPTGAGTGNSRNGSSSKTVSTTNGPVTISVPRDRICEFERTDCATSAGGSGDALELASPIRASPESRGSSVAIHCDSRRRHRQFRWLGRYRDGCVGVTRRRVGASACSP